MTQDHRMAVDHSRGSQNLGNQDRRLDLKLFCKFEVLSGTLEVV